MEKQKPTLSIIGFGQFGKFAAQILKPYFDILISSKNDHSREAKKMGFKFVSSEEAARADFIVLAMPISAVQDALKQISPYVKNGATIIDTCSIKVNPVKHMKKYLPENTKIVAAHPLFGPQSGKHGIKGLKIVIWPIRISGKEYNKIKAFLKKLELEIIEMTPEEHDKTVALWQALTHFIAKGIIKTNLNASKILTPSSQKLISAVSDVKDDSKFLFYDIQKLNPFAKKMREKLIKNLTEINKSLAFPKKNDG